MAINIDRKVLIVDAITGMLNAVDLASRVLLTPLTWRRASMQNSWLSSVFDLAIFFLPEEDLASLELTSRDMHILLYSHGAWRSTRCGRFVAATRDTARITGRQIAHEGRALASSLSCVTRMWAQVDAFHHFGSVQSASLGWTAWDWNWEQPVKPETIASAEAAMHLRLPFQYTAFLMLCDGQPSNAPADACLYGARMLRTRELPGAHKAWLVTVGVTSLSESRDGPEALPDVALIDKPPALYFDPRYLVPVSASFDGGKQLAVDCTSLRRGAVYIMQGRQCTYRSADWASFLRTTIA